MLICINLIKIVQIHYCILLINGNMAKHSLPQVVTITKVVILDVVNSLVELDL